MNRFLAPGALAGGGHAVPRRRWAIVVLSVAAFTLFGVRDGSAGVAWPSIRATFGQPLSALGLLVVSSLAGYLLASVGGGRWAARLPVARRLILASCSAAAGVACFAFSTHWVLLVAGSSLLGVANGTVDVTVNAHMATHRSASTVNLVHAGWGVGTTVGPLLVTASLAISGSWRLAYAVLLIVEVLLLGGFVLTRRLWAALPAGAPRGPDPPAALSATPHTSLALTLTFFFAYTGLELGTGQWAYTFLVSGKGVDRSLAGLAVAAYWAALTAGRLAASGIGSRLRPTTVLDLSLAVVAFGALIVLVSPGGVVAACGLAVAGSGLGPVFPTLVALTPQRFGSRRTATVMGYQLSAAALGGALLTAVIGVALQHLGARALGLVIPAGAAILLGLRATMRALDAR